MSGSNEFRKMAGALLLWSLLPFPFLYVVLPPFWMAAGLAALWRLLRPQHGWRPSSLVLNLLGVVILLVVIAAGGLEIGPLRPLGHLLFLLAALRVATTDDLAGLKRALAPIFLVWVTGVVSAVHVAIVPFVLFSVAFWWFAGMSVFLAELEQQAGVRMGRPRWRHAIAAGVAAAVLSVPVFMVLPRLGSPLLGAAFGRESGFSESVELTRQGAIEESNTPAAYVSTGDGSPVPGDLLRLRATAFDMLFPAVWGPRRTGLTAPNYRQGLVWLDDDRQSLDGTTVVEISLVTRGRFLFLPPGAVAVETGERLSLDPAGGLVVREGSGPPPTYRVWVAPTPPPRLQQPEVRDLYLPGHNDQVGRLAQEVAGSVASAEDKAEVIENFLQTEYSYSLAGGSGRGADPVAWFLLEGREGHCEFFATSMAVMLRHEGVEARIVSGYHGGDAEPGGSVVVRQSHAHTWVEVWLGPEVGWVVYDPTPAEGVDGLTSMSVIDRLRLTWQRIEDFFDRRILTFGFSEQLGIVTTLGDAGRWMMLRLTSLSGAVLAIGSAVVVALAGWVFFLRRSRSRRRPPATMAVHALGLRLERRGVEVPAAATLAWICRRATDVWPTGSPDIGRLCTLAEGELYGPGDDDTRIEVTKIRSRLRQVFRG